MKKILTITKNCLFFALQQTISKEKSWSMATWAGAQEDFVDVLLLLLVFQSYLRSFYLASLNTFYTCTLVVYRFLPTDEQYWKGNFCKQPEQLFGEILNLLKLLRGWRIFFGILINGRNTINIYDSWNKSKVGLWTFRWKLTSF